MQVFVLVKGDTKAKGESILHLYNVLLQLANSPVAALNRTYAVSKVYGKERTIAEAEKLQLTDDHYYYTLLGELYKDIDAQQARLHFETAISLAKSKTDKHRIAQKKSNLKD